jgi:predicted amidohydrolase
MNTTIRFAGAQIPVTPFVRRNTITIKSAIDWAAENNVDYLVTPEASLSGYSINFDAELQSLVDSLAEIEKYAAEKQVGLCLGTLWIEHELYNNKPHPVKRNQIRYYEKNGRFLGTTNKMVLTPLDNKINIVKGEILTGIVLPIGDKFIPAAGLICADLYGHNSNEGGLPEKYLNIGAKLIIHATNADRGIDEFDDEIENIWLEGNIRRVSRLLLPVISVDNCYMMDGTEYHGRTATQSGVCVGGKWVVNVPRIDTQYFYYDFPIDSIGIKFPSDITSV